MHDTSLGGPTSKRLELGDQMFLADVHLVTQAPY